LEFQADFIHELTITHRAVGNVLSGPLRGSRLDLDHHGDAPFENLFQEMAGDLRLQESGSKCYGPPTGARNVYWAVDATPPRWLGYGAIVVGALREGVKEEHGPAAVIEAAAPGAPRDLRAAQWLRRTAKVKCPESVRVP
jgi:hypothetical protein